MRDKLFIAFISEFLIRFLTSSRLYNLKKKYYFNFEFNINLNALIDLLRHSNCD